MEKFYRVIGDNFMWKDGAIISSTGSGYRAVHDFWHNVPLNAEYISDHIIEHPGNARFFQRVYRDTIKGNLFRTADQMVSLYKEAFKE